MVTGKNNDLQGQSKRQAMQQTELNPKKINQPTSICMETDKAGCEFR
jgi:hypothetical protein